MADHFDSKTEADQNTPNTPARHRRVDRHKQLYQDIQRESENQPAAQDTDAQATRVMPALRGGARPAPSTGDTRDNKPGQEPVFHRTTEYAQPQPGARVYGEESEGAADYRGSGQYQPRNAQLDSRLYPEGDDYYEDEDEAPRGRRWLAVIIAVVLVLALFFGAMCLLPKLVERPKDDSGFAGALYSLRDNMSGVLRLVGVEEDPAGMHLFQTVSSDISTGTQVQFSITTTKAVQNVRLMDEQGAPLPGSAQCKDAPTNTTWVVTVRFENAYLGNVYAAVQENDAWRVFSPLVPEPAGL